MDLLLTGKRCVVLGASRGIGRAIARGFAAEGAALAICARDDGALQQAAGELRSFGVPVHAATCDLGDGSALAAFLDAARSALGAGITSGKICRSGRCWGIAALFST